MFAVGDAVLLPPEFGRGRKGVLARKEPDGFWLVQIGTTGYDFLAEKDLRPLIRVSECRYCGAQLNPDQPSCHECPDDAGKCPVCGTCDWEKSK